jgi:hypothetical protein
MDRSKNIRLDSLPESSLAAVEEHLPQNDT